MKGVAQLREDEEVDQSGLIRFTSPRAAEKLPPDDRMHLERMKAVSLERRIDKATARKVRRWDIST